jgi:hypothetical protein
MTTIYKTFRTRPILLAGPAVYESLYTAECVTTLRLGRVIYDEASSADAGVAVRIGKIGSASYFKSYTTEISKPAGTVVNLSQISLTLNANESLTVECDGNKDGVGTISIQIEAQYEINL